MGLTREQKNLVKAWVAAGLKDQQIIEMAKKQVPPFHLTRQNLSKNYRKHTERKIRDIVSREAEESVLRQGLALREERVKLLGEVAKDLAERSKHIKEGSYPAYVSQLRGCLDDIAKEMGERREKVDVNANVHMRDIVAIMEKVYGND